MDMNLETMRQRLLEAAIPVEAERVALEDAWQRVLAEDAVADTDFPPFDRSPLDGFAVIAGEVDRATPDRPVLLRETGWVPAGAVAGVEVTPGTTFRVTTGAALPPGATGVVRAEDAVREAGLVLILRGAGAGHNVCRRGEEMARGTRALAAGTVIDAGAMATLAQLGLASPLVHRRPRVGILVIGSELTRVEAAPIPGKVHDSNSYMLCAQAREAGAEPVLLGLIHDDVAGIQRRIRQARGCDLVITTGGVSGGDFDLAVQAFAGLGAGMFLERAGTRRSKPILGGLVDRRPVIGLSGNPAAASIAFEELIRPVLLKMGGQRCWWRRKVRGRMAKSFARASGPRRLLWAYSWLDEGGLSVEALPMQGGGGLRSALLANSLIAVEENSPPLSAGDDIEVILLQSALGGDAPGRGLRA